uniref:Medium-chain acyl-CoA ligase ACSF2, mitochondrial n=1 Tax=Arion vulgaris TaxID=1028688 RepID=A0A0B7AQC8_9EUPU
MLSLSPSFIANAFIAGHSHKCWLSATHRFLHINNLHSISRAGVNHRFHDEGKHNRTIISSRCQYKVSDDRCSSVHTSAQTNTLKWSYTHGASSIPLLGMTIGKRLQEQVEVNPDKTAVVFFQDGVKLTFAEMLDKVDKLAAGFQSLGVRKGDRVGIWGPNTAEWVLTQYATARAGIILVNVNPSYRTRELEYALKKAGCKLLVASASFKGVDYLSMLREIIPELDTMPGEATINSKVLPDLKYILTIGLGKFPGTFRFDDILTSATLSQRQSIFDLQDQLQFDDPINIQFTSGTTGSPKGVTLSHHNILNNSYFAGFRCGYHQHEAIICVPVPLYHCFGMVLGSMAMISHGATVVWPSPVFDAGFTLRAIEEFRCTSLLGVPTMFIDLLSHPVCASTNFSSMYTGIMSASPCPITLCQAVTQRMNMQKFTVCYGSTETSPVSFQSSTECALDKRVSTVGKVLDHIEGKVINHEGQIVPIGSVGELCTRGPNNMLGYWDDPEKTAKSITPDHWYHTGDLAVMSTDGYCAIVGRIKDMLIRGGENIYPLEIEQVLYQNPKIRDVQVIGVPDKRLGEQVCAWIVVKDGMTLTQKEVTEFCRDKMAKFKIPHYILFVNDFPTTVTGKVQKFVLREEAIKKLNLIEN